MPGFLQERESQDIGGDTERQLEEDLAKSAIEEARMRSKDKQFEGPNNQDDL